MLAGEGLSEKRPADAPRGPGWGSTCGVGVVPVVSVAGHSTDGQKDSSTSWTLWAAVRPRTPGVAVSGGDWGLLWFLLHWYVCFCEAAQHFLPSPFIRQCTSCDPGKGTGCAPGSAAVTWLHCTEHVASTVGDRGSAGQPGLLQEEQLLTKGGGQLLTLNPKPGLLLCTWGPALLLPPAGPTAFACYLTDTFCLAACRPGALPAMVESLGDYFAADFSIAGAPVPPPGVIGRAPDHNSRWAGRPGGIASALALGGQRGSCSHGMRGCHCPCQDGHRICWQRRMCRGLPV